MPIPPVSRRQFVATGTALLASRAVPAWTELFQAGASADAIRAEVADAALARATALGASYADIRVNRYRRESIATRERQVQNVSRSTSYGLGLRVLVNGAWGFAATNRVDPAAARAAADQAVAIARANAVLATRKVVLAAADRVVTTWANPITRDPFEVPLETKTAFLMALNEKALGRGGREFRQLAAAVRRRAEVLRVERGLAHHASGWCVPTRSSRPPPPTAPPATSRPAPWSIAPSCSATSTSRTTRGCRTPSRPGTRWSRS